MNIHEKNSLVEAGRAALNAAIGDMPMLAGIREEIARTQPLKGERIAGCLHLTKETGVLIDLFHAASTEIVWTGGDEVSTQDEIAVLLSDRGITVFGWRNMLSNEVETALKETLNHFDDGPTIIIDNGARLITAALDEPQRFPSLKYMTEKTTEGCAKLRERASREDIPFPVFLVNEVVTK